MNYYSLCTLDISVRPFEVDIPEFALRDLMRRLKNTRMGDDLEDADFYYGFQVLK